MDKTVEELRNLGNKKFRELNYGAALMYYTQGIDKDPNSYALYYNRAVTFVKMDNIEEAKEDLNKSLSIKPDYIPSLCQLGFVYLYQGNTPDSLESYVKVVKINETLPHQLNRFKAQLKEAIRLAESRCRQQEYSDSFIDAIITREIRDILDGYPNLPTHMVESGIPSVSFGNVPISHHAGSLGPSATVIASGAIPITVRRNRNNAADIANTTTTDNNATNTANITDITNPNNINDIISHIPGLNNFLNPAGGAIAASISVQELPNNNNGSNASDNYQNSNETNTEVAAENINGNTPEPRHTPVIVNPISSNFNNRNDNVRTPALDFISLHRAAHESAVNRAAELRRQREQERRDREERQRNSTNEFTTAAAPSPPSPPTAPSPASSVNPTITSPTSTTVNTAPGVDFARHIASMVASQFGGGASSSGEPASLAQNLTTIASGVLGGLANVNNAHNANSSSSTTTSTDANSTNISTNFNNTNTTNTNHNNDLEDLDMDLD